MSVALGLQMHAVPVCTIYSCPTPRPSPSSIQGFLDCIYPLRPVVALRLELPIVITRPLTPVTRSARLPQSSSRAPITHRSVTFETEDAKRHAYHHQYVHRHRRLHISYPPRTLAVCARSTGSISSSQRHLTAWNHGGTIRGRQRCCE
jgi:hypothetical protein